jgi:hypothetical protein
LRADRYRHNESTKRAYQLDQVPLMLHLRTTGVAMPIGDFIANSTDQTEEG